MSYNCTRTLVKDFIFQRKHNLSDTQTMFISYLTLLPNWAIKMQDDFFVLLTSKIESDLKMGIKTIEATLTKLKKLGLIETKLVKIPFWDTDKNFRAIRLTEEGKKYNLSYLKPEELKIVEQAEASIKSYEDEIYELKKQLKKQIAKNKKEEKEKKDEEQEKIEAVKTFSRRALMPFLHQDILGLNGEVFMVNKITPVLDGVQIRLQHKEKFYFTYAAYQGSTTIDPENAEKLLTSRKNLYLEQSFREYFAKVLEFLHFIVMFKNQEYILQKIEEKENLQVYLKLELKNPDDETENIPKIVELTYNIYKTINFLRKNGFEDFSRKKE